MNAVVYPYFSVMDLDALKTASLYFDHVYLLNPISIIQSDEIPLYHVMVRRLMDEFGDVLRLVSPEEAWRKDPWVGISIEVKKASNPLVKAGILQVINPFDEFKSCGLHTILSSRLKEAAYQIELKRFTSSTHPRHRETIVAHFAPSQKDDDSSVLMLSTSLVKDILNDAAAVLAISRAATPLALRYTGSWATTESIFTAGPLSRGNIHTYAQLRRSYDGLRIANETIVSQLPSFSEVSFEQILELREEQKDALQAFREEMLRCATQIKCLPKDISYEQAIVDVARGTIIPAFRQLRESLRATRLVFVRKLIDDISSMTGLATFIGSVYVGMPVHAALLLSAAVVGAKATAQAFVENKQIKDMHGLSLLLQIDKKTRTKGYKGPR